MLENVGNIGKERCCLFKPFGRSIPKRSDECDFVFGTSHPVAVSAVSGSGQQGSLRSFGDQAVCTFEICFRWSLTDMAGVVETCFGMFLEMFLEMFFCFDMCLTCHIISQLWLCFFSLSLGDWLPLLERGSPWHPPTWGHFWWCAADSKRWGEFQSVGYVGWI